MNLVEEDLKQCYFVADGLEKGIKGQFMSEGNTVSQAVTLLGAQPEETPTATVSVETWRWSKKQSFMMGSRPERLSTEREWQK